MEAHMYLTLRKTHGYEYLILMESIHVKGQKYSFQAARERIQDAGASEISDQTRTAECSGCVLPEQGADPELRPPAFPHDLGS